MKCIRYFTFGSVIDSLGARSDGNIKSGTILSFDVVHVGSLVAIMLQSKICENPTQSRKPKFVV